ncbi:MAG: histidinol-phosphate transaminase [Lachnospiraceae bacterium]|nr:histidinol-phosphate transaminase [Lachnospiraceae bacterium]
MKKWEANIRKVVPYTPGEQPNQPDMIKLNTNENPYPPAPGVREALLNLDVDRLRLYPDPACSKLVKALAKRYQVGEDQVFVGVGSDDVLAMCFQTFFNSKKPILFPDISYSFYPVWADLFGIPYEMQPLDEEFRIVKEDYYRENGGIIFPNPNAPTSLLIEHGDVEDIIAHNQESVVIVDEAYIDFAEGPSAIELLDQYENLLVVQTFSKSRSMCGMRIGFAIGSPALIRSLNDVKYAFNSYTLGLPSLELGTAAVEDEAYFRETIGKIKATRERSKEALRELGFTYLEPSANFIFATHPSCDAKALFEGLKKEHIYVRYFAKPRIDRYLRITIGTDAEMDRMFEVLKRLVEQLREA